MTPGTSWLGLLLGLNPKLLLLELCRDSRSPLGGSWDYSQAQARPCTREQAEGAIFVQGWLKPARPHRCPPAPGAGRTAMEQSGQGPSGGFSLVPGAA